MRKKDFRKFINSGNKAPRKIYKKQFKKEISQFVDLIHEDYKLFKLVDKDCRNDYRRSFTSAYLYHAINDLISSFDLFLSGYIVPSGNLLRQFTESCAMAILLSNNRINYFNYFKKHWDNKTIDSIKVNKAFSKVSDNLNKLGISRRAWNEIRKIRNFEHQYSHPTLLSLTANIDFCSENEILGPHYDLEKIGTYGKEMGMRIIAAKYLKSIIEKVMSEFIQK